jgi:RHS repeat-associated protein
VLGRLIAKAYAYEKSAHEGVHEGALGDVPTGASSTETPTTYTYDRLGRMQQAVNGDAQVSFAYDALSQLVEETQVHLADVQNAADADASTFTFKHQYDALGNRIQSVLPSGKTVQWLYYGSGHLHQLLVDGHVVSDMERDALHREISRSQGQLTSQYQFDPMGRLTAHRVSRNGSMQGLPGSASAQALYDKGRISGPAAAAHALQATLAGLPGGQQIQRQFQYDAAGNLSGVADSLRGTTRYAYDALSRIRGAQSGAKGEHTELFAFDPAGNLLNPNQGGAQSSGGVGDRDVVRTNRIHVYQDLRFTYDVHGNVTERLIGWHTAQHYRYSPEHQLLEVTVTRYQEKSKDKPTQVAPGTTPTSTVQTTRYRYDALGRRIDKTDAFGRTSFVYDGDLLTAKLRGSRVSEYLYEPDSFVPLAKLESALGSGSGVDPANKATDSSTADSTAKRERLMNEGKEGKARLKLMLAKKADSETVRAETAEALAANDAPDPTDNDTPPHKPKTFQLYYYHCDQIGAPQELTNEEGRIVWAAQYKVWGETQPLEFLKTGTDDVVFSSRSRPLALANRSDAQALNLIEQPLRFQGQYFDQETGLHYNRYRYYDPVVGRFIHQDPIGLEGGTNNFIFAPNSTAWIDPLGLATYVIIGEGQATIESYAKEMREKRPCDTFITIKNDWKSVNDEALKSGKFNSKEWEQKAVAGNAKWIREQSAKGYGFIDLGTDSAANRSPFYAAEKKALERTKAKVFKPNRCAAGRARDSSKPSQRPKAKGRY